MDTTQPFRIDRTAAATVRDWLVDEHHTGEHGSPVSESLYHLAALLDDGLEESGNTLGVRVTTGDSEAENTGTGTPTEPVRHDVRVFGLRRSPGVSCLDSGVCVSRGLSELWDCECSVHCE